MRYIVFAGEFYYPRGGARDIVSRHDDRGEALSAMRAVVAPGGPDWSHVLDVVAGEILDTYDARDAGCGREDWRED